MEVICREADKKVFEDLGFDVEEDGTTIGREVFDHLVLMVDQEANYAHAGDIPINIPWTGHHGEGGSYGPCALVCDGKEVAEVATSDGDICVTLNDNDEIPPVQMRNVKAYRRVREEAEKLLKDRSAEWDPEKGFDDPPKPE